MNNNMDLCQCKEVQEQVVENIKESIPDEAIVQKLADLFKVFGDGTLLKIFYALLQKELCVCDICEIVEMSQSSVSHQLRLLKTTGLVKYRKEGKTVFYSLDDEHVNSIFNVGLSHIKHKLNI